MPIINDGIYWSVTELMVPGPGTPYSMEGHREYVRRFRVVVLVKGLSHIMVARCPGLPIGGSLYVGAGGYEYDLLACLTEINCKSEYEDDWQNWIVECHYSTKVGTFQEGGVGGSGSPGGSQDQPELERPKVSWDMETVQYANWFTDRKGVFIGSSAKMPFSPPMSFPIAHPVLNIVRKELNYNVSRAEDYAYALNNATFLGYPEGTVQCMPPHAEQAWKGKYRFWIVTYKIRFSPIVWIPKTPRIAVKFDGPDPKASENPEGGTGGYDYDPNYGDPNEFIPIGESPEMFNEAGQPTPPTLPGGSTFPKQGGGILPETTSPSADRPPWLIRKGPYTYYLGWQPLVLDQGMYRLPVWPPLNDPSFVGPPPQAVVEGVPVPIFRAGVPIAHPDLLDGSGQPVKKDANGYRRPVYLGFITYRYRNMTDLIVTGLGG